MGSKARIAKHIVPILNEAITQHKAELYIEPFVGGCNVIEHIKCEKRYGYDNNKYLIEFWRRLQDGWNPLDDVAMSKQLYDDVRTNIDNAPPISSLYVVFAPHITLNGLAVMPG